MKPNGEQSFKELCIMLYNNVEKLYKCEIGIEIRSNLI